MQVLNREFLRERKEELINFPDWIPIVLWFSIFSYEDMHIREEIIINNKTILEKEKKHGQITKFIGQNIAYDYDIEMLDLYMFTLAHPEFAPAINKTEKEKAAYRKVALKYYKDIL